MRWIILPDGSKYTLAVDIQKIAEQNGYTVPCEADGTRHPGTDCNAKMRTIFKDAGLRRTFGITDQCVVDIRNAAFIKWLNDRDVISDYYVRLGVVQLYTIEAVNALLSVMLKTYVSYEADDGDEEYEVPVLPVRHSHNFEKKMNKPKASLFKK